VRRGVTMRAPAERPSGRPSVHLQGDHVACDYKPKRTPNRDRAERLLFSCVAFREIQSVTKSEQYRLFARECLAMAHDAKDERITALLKHMAEVWFRLSESSSNAGDKNGEGRG
jgi:hypothetical protein